MEKALEIKMELTREDYVDFQKYLFVKTKLKSSIVRVIIMSLIISFIFTIGHPFVISDYLTSVIMVVFIFGTIYFGGLILFVFNRIKKMPSDKGSLLGAKKILIDDEGFIQESDNSKTLQKWNGVNRIETNKKSIFIFIDNFVAYVIPKRYFKNENEVTEFISTLETKRKNSQLTI